jgi:hypothetical protein
MIDEPKLIPVKVRVVPPAVEAKLGEILFIIAVAK